MSKRFMVTGGAGFIGSAVVRHLVANTPHAVLVADKLTYAANLDSLAAVASSPRYRFEQVDICDAATIDRLIGAFKPDVIMHLAAESHVDRSIDGPAEFIETNICGTFTLLDVALRYYRALQPAERQHFRFHHISTDEVFGSLGPDGHFREDSPYQPNSPYSASKAASDHLVRAWHHTFGLPVVLSNCSNNYGPFHFPEKLIPLVITNALLGRELPVYGNGQNVRDWLYVEDHARALLAIVSSGKPGESYNVGGRNERSNLAVVHAICDCLDRLQPRTPQSSYRSLIRFVDDRPGHDFRYAIDPRKIEHEVSWKARETFDTGLEKTVRWYLDNEAWWRPIREAKYDGGRLGLAAPARLVASAG